MTSESHVLAVISLYKCYAVSSLISDGNLNTLEPRYKEGSGDWQNIFAITRFRLSRFQSIYFTITGAKNIVRYTEEFVLYRGSLNRGPLYIYFSLLTTITLQVITLHYLPQT